MRIREDAIKLCTKMSVFFSHRVFFLKIYLFAGKTFFTMNVKKQKNKCKSLNSYFAQTLVVVTEATIEIFC